MKEQKKNTQKYFWYYIILLVFASCTQPDPRLVKALNIAGENKKEFLKVLNYYKDGDSLKYEAACFLIKNMPYYGFYEGEELHKYLRYFEGYSKTQKTAQEFVDSLKKEDGEFNRKKLTYKPDIITIDSAFLVNHIEWSFKVWREQPWGKNVSFDDFLEYVLPYRIENEPLSLWQKELYEKYNPMLDDFRSSTEAGNPMLAAQILLDTLKKNKYRYTGLFPNGPHIGPATLRWNTGSCTEFADGVIYVLRSVGIPCGVDRALLRGDTNAGHSWNFTLDDNRQTYIVELPYSMKWKLASKYNLPKGKAYRVTYGPNEDIIQKLTNTLHIYPTFKNPLFKDVTEEYAGNKKRTIIIPKDELDVPVRKNDPIYLCLSNKQKWYPVDFTFMKKDTIRFDNVEGGIVSLLATWDGNELTLLTDPFLIDTETDQLHFFTPEEKSRKVNLYLKYHLMTSLHFKHMLNGVIEGSNRKDFKDADTLYQIKEIPYRLYTVAKLKAGKSYRYVRYRGQDFTHCTIAELSLFENFADSIPLKGEIMGTPGTYDDNIRHEYTSAFDSNPNTFFFYKEFCGGWTGLDFGKPYKVRKAVYTPRNDINFIYKGDIYELFYWDKKHWNSVGKQTAMADSLVYTVPCNSLLYLKNHSHGKDERIFEYRDGKQLFW